MDQSGNIKDECYGKQIDYYNQLPNSSRMIENLIERLEKAESLSSKYKKYLFSKLIDCSFGECDGDFIIYYADGDASGAGFWSDVGITFKLDKEKNQILIDIYKNHKFGVENVLPTQAIIDINDHKLNIWQSDACGDWTISFKNKADWEKRRRREIQELHLPQWTVNEVENSNLIDFFYFLSNE